MDVIYLFLYEDFWGVQISPGSNYYSTSMHNSPGYSSHDPGNTALCSFSSSLSHGCLNYNLLISQDLRLIPAQSLLRTFNPCRVKRAPVWILGKQIAHNLDYMHYAAWVGLGLGALVWFFILLLFLIHHLKAFRTSVPSSPVLLTSPLNKYKNPLRFSGSKTWGNKPWLHKMMSCLWGRGWEWRTTHSHPSRNTKVYSLEEKLSFSFLSFPSHANQNQFWLLSPNSFKTVDPLERSKETSPVISYKIIAQGRQANFTLKNSLASTQTS